MDWRIIPKHGLGGFKATLPGQMPVANVLFQSRRRPHNHPVMPFAKQRFATTFWIGKVSPESSSGGSTQ
jgi:hypothetical protein